MSPVVRGTLALILLAVMVVVGFQIATADASQKEHASTAANRWQSSQQCESCHHDIFEEWKGSHHQIAYLNPDVRLLSDDFRNKECQACHLPRPISVTGYGQRTLPRLTLPDEGVSCLTCHLGKDGQILGRNNRPGAPCKPTQSTDLVAVDLCASCHNQHQTTDQWRQSHYAAEGTNCNHCHMPEVERPLGNGKKKTGFDHAYRGCHDKAMLQKAGKLIARVEGRELVLGLENVGAGHNFPTEERHRAVDILCRFHLADGSDTAWKRAWRFRQPYRDEPGENTQLPAGQKKVVRVPVPEKATKAQVRLWYRLTPYVGDDDPKSTLLVDQEVSL
jgi:Cytochrome c554 and c-prime